MQGGDDTPCRRRGLGTAPVGRGENSEHAPVVFPRVVVPVNQTGRVWETAEAVVWGVAAGATAAQGVAAKAVT